SQPRGEELDHTDEVVKYFENRLRQYPEMKRYVSRVTPQRAMIRVMFPDSLQNTDVPPSIKDQLVGESVLFGGTEVRVTGYGQSFYGGATTAPNYSIKVLGYNYEKVRDIAQDVGKRLQ